MEIITNNYTNILKQITDYIQDTKIKMYWNIGKILFENRVNKITMNQLSEDLQISVPHLYRTLNFYKAYPDAMPNNDLSWSQYAVLSEVKDPEFRNILEDKAKTEALSSREIKKEIQIANEHVETLHCNVSTNIQKTQLIPNRGELYNYKLSKITDDGKIFLDLGFRIEKYVEKISAKVLQNDSEIVKVNKLTDGTYELIDAQTNARKIHTYKGELLRIVDGDTIRVKIDLGFGVFYEEILRLRDVYAEELKTEIGKEHKKILEKILKNVEFVVLRTYKIDKYGRYVCDVFYEENFLNQELVDLFH